MSTVEELYSAAEKLSGAPKDEVKILHMPKRLRICVLFD